MQGTPRHVSWKELLGPSSPGSHYVQLYDREEFLAQAVAHFTAEGLARGEAVVLTPMAEHVAGIRRELAARGIDADAALRSGQLSLGTAQDGVLRILGDDGMPDPARFKAVAGGAVARARADSRFREVRWWGEMTGFMLRAGNRAAGLAAEGLADALAKEDGVTLFCSHQCDRFSVSHYDDLHEVCCRHSHVIPAEDYAWHRQVVNRAIADVLGAIDGSALQSLVSWNGLPCDMPSSQALLFWLREAMPHRFDAILARARAHHDARLGRDAAA